MVDHDSDEELVKVDAKAAEAIDLHCDQGPVACIQVSSPAARKLSGALHARMTFTVPAIHRSHLSRLPNRLLCMLCTVT